MIPRRRSTTKPAAEQPPIEYEEVDVTDLDLTFATSGPNPHLLPIRLFPGDTLEESANTIKLVYASGLELIVHKDKLLYSGYRKHTIKRTIKPEDRLKQLIADATLPAE